MSKYTVVILLYLVLSPLSVIAQIEVGSGFSLDQANTIESAYQEWINLHGSSRSIRVESFQGRSTMRNDGVIVTSEEQAAPGKIYIDPTMATSSKKLREIVLHAMTHAEQSNYPKMFSKPIQFPDGELIGYHGASIKIKLNTGQETFWRILEEALSERNASLIKGYKVSHPSYFAVGSLALRHFPIGVDVMSMIRQNDVHSLIAMILGKNKSQVTDEDIGQVMKMYQNAWNNG